MKCRVQVYFKILGDSQDKTKAIGKPFDFKCKWEVLCWKTSKITLATLYHAIKSGCFTFQFQPWALISGKLSDNQTKDSQNKPQSLAKYYDFVYKLIECHRVLTSSHNAFVTNLNKIGNLIPGYLIQAFSSNPDIVVHGTLSQFPFAVTVQYTCSSSERSYQHICI